MLFQIWQDGLLHEIITWISGQTDKQVRTCFTGTQSPFRNYKSESYRCAANVQMDHSHTSGKQGKKPHVKAGLWKSNLCVGTFGRCWPQIGAFSKEKLINVVKKIFAHFFMRTNISWADFEVLYTMPRYWRSTGWLYLFAFSM